jgi:hypothetical protein
MQELRPEERREFQRLGVSTPIPATLGTTPVSILEIGVLGARLQHSGTIEGHYAELRFSHGGTEIDIKCEIVRTLPAQSPYPNSGLESGVRFLAAVGESGDRLREMLGELVAREINARQRQGTAMIEPPVDGDRTVRGKDAGFICFRFENSRWTKRAVFLPEQPASGFTVARISDADEIQRLCQVYEASDEEGRRLIRVFAELSVSDVLQIPPAV